MFWKFSIVDPIWWTKILFYLFFKFIINLALVFEIGPNLSDTVLEGFQYLINLSKFNMAYKNGVLKFCFT